MSTPDVRPLTQADLDWAVEVTRVRRHRLEAHAPPVDETRVLGGGAPREALDAHARAR